ncbi:MAG: ABC-2 transporter permease [Coriobacteriales bacterium]
MKAMVFSDLITSKGSALALLGITALVAVFISIPTGTLYGTIGACAAMIPFIYLFTICAYDELNGWERYRLTLPISRRQVVYGRYASMLIICACSLVLAVALGLAIGLVAELLPESIVPDGLRLSNIGVGEVVGTALLTQVVILLVATLTLPFIMRYGMTKATRIAPMLLIFVISGGMVLLSNTPIAVHAEAFLGGLEMWGMVLLAAVIVVVVLGLYALSALIAAHLYEHREL